MCSSDLQARVFADAAARLIRKEVDRARRFVGKDDPAAFEAWLGKFYEEHENHVRESFLPATQATMELMVGPMAAIGIRSLKILDQYAKEHCAESMKQLRQAWAEKDIEGLCQDWETNRPAFICDHLPQRILEAAK